MVDVDDCTRWAEMGLIVAPEWYAKKIASLDEKRKVVIFREKEAEEIAQILKDGGRLIREEIAKEFAIDEVELGHASANNREWADLYTILPNGERVDIEVKFGKKTDHAVGMAIFRGVFGVDAFEKELSLGKRQGWEKKLLQEYPGYDNQEKRLREALNRAVGIFNRRVAGTILTSEQARILEGAILNNSGTLEMKNRGRYMIFEYDKGRMVRKKLLKMGVGEWEVRPVEEVGLVKKRVIVWVKNNESNLKIKFVLNFKNDKFVKELGVKVPARLGLRTPSWNVWINDCTR